MSIEALTNRGSDRLSPRFSLNEVGTLIIPESPNLGILDLQIPLKEAHRLLRRLWFQKNAGEGESCHIVLAEAAEVSFVLKGALRPDLKYTDSRLISTTYTVCDGESSQAVPTNKLAETMDQFHVLPHLTSLDYVKGANQAVQSVQALSQMPSTDLNWGVALTHCAGLDALYTQHRQLVGAQILETMENAGQAFLDLGSIGVARMWDRRTKAPKLVYGSKDGSNKSVPKYHNGGFPNENELTRYFGPNNLKVW